MKRFLKKLSIFLVIFAMLGSFVPTKAAETFEENYAGKIIILHSNDVHGNIDGYTYMAEVYDQFMLHNPDKVIMVDAGDYSQGSIYVSSSKGKDAITLMNSVGYDIIGLGNHEFDYGLDTFAANVSEFNGYVICGNITKKSNGDSLFDLYHVVNASGVKIGFIGILTPETQTKSSPKYTADYNWPMGEALYNRTADVIDAVEVAGADITILLAHLGVDDESEGNRSTDLYNALQTKGKAPDFIIDGHSHTVMTKGPSNEPIQSTGTQFANIGVIVIDAATKKIENNYLISTEDMTCSTHSALAVQTKVNLIKKTIDNEYRVKAFESKVNLNGEKLGPVNKEINGETVRFDYGNRTGETNTGDLITDSLLWKAQKDDLVTREVDGVVALQNGGGIRAWIYKGDVSKSDILSVLPFGNTTTVIYVDGKTLQEALEAAIWDGPTGTGGFPQIAGMRIYINLNNEPDKGDRYPNSTYYKPNSIQQLIIRDINGKPFKEDGTYAVITNNFITEGGDQYSIFSNVPSADIIDTGITSDLVLTEYVQDGLNGVIPESYAQPEGRIIYIQKGEEIPTEPDSGVVDLMALALPAMIASVATGYYVVRNRKH